MKSKYFSCCRIPLPSTVHVQKVHVPCGCFSICSPVCISIKKGFVLFVSPLIGCAGRSIPHCEFSVSLPASRASHRLCTRSMASAASASFPAQPRAAHRARPASMPMCSASGGAAAAWRGRGLTPRSPASFPLASPRTDTATSICCAPRTCSGRAGAPGSGARPSAGAASKRAAGPARTGRTAWAATW